ncbi:threonine dehydratase biosynthetic [Klebsiella aerogenes]|nr:threonine dehydratase biosynthetic [Klebsiella aerogenes]
MLKTLHFCRGTPESRAGERERDLQLLNDGGYSVVDLSDDEMAKLHVRYMVGGRPSKALQERLFSFEFPESPGALLKFLHTLGTHWNISLFHYVATAPTMVGC